MVYCSIEIEKGVTNIVTQEFFHITIALLKLECRALE